MPVVRSFMIDKKKTLKAGHYRTVAASGLITGVAAGTASAGHLFSFRNPSASLLVVVTRIRFFWATLVGFTAAQEIAMEAFRASAFTVDDTGGTAVTPAKRRNAFATASLAAARIATTGALTGGTVTLAAQPLLRRGVLELADGAAVAKRSFEVEWIPRDDHGEVLAQNEGIIIRNAILMGAGGVGRLTVEVDHYDR